MTRAYVTRRLLEHGPLTFGEFVSITGWTHFVVGSALSGQMRQGIVTIRNINGRRHYELT